MAPVGVHQHVFRASAVEFRAYEHAPVVVPEPPGPVGRNGLAVVTAELPRLVCRIGQAGQCVAVGHFAQKRRFGNHRRLWRGDGKKRYAREEEYRSQNSGFSVHFFSVFRLCCAVLFVVGKDINFLLFVGNWANFLFNSLDCQ